MTKDIHIMQFCAANLPPADFLVHVLFKYGLVNWARKDIEVELSNSNSTLKSNLFETI